MKSCPFNKLLIVSWHIFLSDVHFTVGARWVCTNGSRTRRMTYIKLIFCIIRNYNPFFSCRVLSYTECTQKAAVTVKREQTFTTAFCYEYKYLLRHPAGGKYLLFNRHESFNNEHMLRHFPAEDGILLLQMERTPRFSPSYINRGIERSLFKIYIGLSWKIAESTAVAILHLSLHLRWWQWDFLHMGCGAMSQVL